MKKENRRAISFITTLALVFTTFFSAGVSFATESVDSAGAPQLLIAPAPVSAFSDIVGHWGEAAINQAVTNGFVRGYEDGSFKPDKAVTRGEFVTMVNKALQLRDENTVNLLFEDVKTTDWYYKDIQKASYARYVNGISDTSFIPEKNISREEAAAMLSRFLPKVGFLAETQVAAFPDSTSVSTWAKSALAVVINKGYMTGHANGNLAPLGTLTRAEAAKIIGKILDNETIVREDISVATSGDILKDKIYVGNITIEKSVGEGDATLDNLSALSVVYVLGGGVNTVTIKDALIIKLVVCKEGTKVRVLSSGGATIFETLVFNGNLVVDESGASVSLGEAGYENIVYVEGTVSASDAIKIAKEIASKLDSTGKITQEQAAEGAEAVLTGTTAVLNPDGSIKIIAGESPAPEPSHSHSGGSSGSSDSNESGGGDSGSGSSDGITTASAISGSDYCGHSDSLGGFTEVATITSGSSITTAYAIYTAKQLQHLALHLNSNAILMNDITFNATTGAGVGTAMAALSEAAITSGTALRIPSFTAGNFVPIGLSATVKYTGTFYGNNKNVLDLDITTSSTTGAIANVGLFGYTSGATIKDFTISGGAISGAQYVGSVAGQAYYSTISGISNMGAVNGSGAHIGGIVGYNAASRISYSHNEGTVTGTGTVGGLAGKNAVGTISNSHNTAAVTGNGDNVGGITGNAASGTVSDCYNTGAIIGTGNYTGGVVGNNYGTVSSCHNTAAISAIRNVGGVAGASQSLVTNSYNTGAVSGTESYVGGVVGNLTSATVSGISNTGSVNGGSYVGGVVGYNYNATVTDSNNTGTVSGTGLYVGGIAGSNYDAKITNSYNSGKVTVAEDVNHVGGVVGYNGNSSTVSNCYNTGPITGSGWNVGGVVGDNNLSLVNYCYNTGEVSGAYVGGIAGTNEGDQLTISNSYNAGIVSGTGSRVGGVVGYNKDKAEVRNTYNTGAVSGTVDSVGGIIGYNYTQAKVIDSYNTGAVTGASKVGSAVGWNAANSIVTDCSWLQGSNLKTSIGIGSDDNSQTTTNFTSDATLTAIYTSMSAIATSAGGTTVGAITAITFSTVDNIPTAYSVAQGAYIVSAGALTITVSAIGSSTITVTTASSLATLVSPGGIQVDDLPDVSNTFALTGASGSWVMIKATSTSNPSLNRSYTIYFK